MAEPPPPPFHQQEPPYQSPPRTPPPFHQQERAYQSPPPPFHQQELWYQSPPRTPPPLHQREPSYQSPPRPPPLLHQKEPPYQSPPRPPRPFHQQEPWYQSPPRPPPPLHQREPSYQSPPRPPWLLHQQEPPYQSPPRPPRPLHQQEPSQAAPRPRGPVITYMRTPRTFHTPNENFMSLVQRLTGKPPTSTTPSSSSPYTSSAPNYTSAPFDESPAMEKSKPRPGFVGGVETTDQRPNLSAGPSSLWAELFSTTSPQGLKYSVEFFPSPSPPTSSIPHGDDGPPKRRRFDLGHDMQRYVPRDEDRGIPHSVNGTRSIGSDYDIPLRRIEQTPSLPSEEVGRFNGVGGMGRLGGDSLYMGGELMTGRGGVFPSGFGPNGTRAIGFDQQDLAGRLRRELLRLPPNATSTLFVEGLPLNCSMREVAHIFRSFSGYKKVRLVTKDSTQRNEDPVVLCFVDFENPACAATARNVLQGYQMDEDEPDSESLQIQFSRNPGPRPG